MAVGSVGLLDRWFREWWRLAYLSAAILVLGLSPSSYNAAMRVRIAQRAYSNTAPILTGFMVVCALVTVVLTHIVLTTAVSYGLSQYALQVLIRVLVLELIPLTAALFVALRCSIADGVELLALQAPRDAPVGAAQDLHALQGEAMPRALSALLAGITLTALSSIVVTVVAYLTSYGFSASGFASYTRMFGQVFSPAVTLIFTLKSLIFCLTVALIPMASAFVDQGRSQRQPTRTSAEMRALVRMFTLVLLFEVLSLVGNYY